MVIIGAPAAPCSRRKYLPAEFWLLPEAGNIHQIIVVPGRVGKSRVSPVIKASVSRTGLGKRDVSPYASVIVVSLVSTFYEVSRNNGLATGAGFVSMSAGVCLASYGARKNRKTNDDRWDDFP